MKRTRDSARACLLLTPVLLAACDPSGDGGAAAGGASGAPGGGASSSGGLVRYPSTGGIVVRVPAGRGDAGAGASDGGDDGSSGGSGSSGTSGSSGSAGSGGSGGSPVAQCVPASPLGAPPATEVCGDGFRTGHEACDDGNTNDGDGCSATCKVTPQLVSPRAAPGSGAPPLASRSIGAGRHPLAAGCNTVAVAFADHTTEPPALVLSTFSLAGVPQTTLPLANVKVSEPNPGVAVLPGDALAVAWTDFDDDELGVSLRKIVPGMATQSASIIANEDSAFSQSDPDIVFDDNELVVAWVDSHDPTTSPDIRYRLFAPDLTPLTGDQTLAATSAVEDSVVLAGRNGHWAAAWRAGAQGQETIEAQSGTTHWSIGPFPPGVAGDRPDLIFLDDAHLAVAFTMGTDPHDTGVADVSRLHAAVLDPRTPGLTESFMLAPALSPYSETLSLGQSEPSLVLAADHLLIGWRSDARPGDARGSELWSRRVPFSVNGDTVTLDPSHIEVPVVQRDAQRDGDQNAFRMVSTTLSPSGGIASVWEDTSQSFGAISGGQDVALQLVPDFSEPPEAPKGYPVSADGKYYAVNLLHRNFLPPTASATFANGAYQLGQSAPPLVFDGRDSAFTALASTPGDPNAIVTLTVDMGQYFSVGAVRPLYQPFGGGYPLSQRIRLATKLGAQADWKTVVDAPVVPADTTVSFDATAGRFLELTMLGNGCNLLELFVYPSAQTLPPPTAADGYDLSSIGATSAVNDNFFPPGGGWPQSWPVGAFYPKSLAWGATGDAVATVDLGAQYDVSRLGLGFFWSTPWANGGRVEVAATPDDFSTIYDSGLGQPFTPWPALPEFFFPSRPVRYIRATDYFQPGVGAAPGVLWSVQAFQTATQHIGYYPLSADGKYFLVNLARRATGDIQPTASLLSNSGVIPSWNPQAVNAANVIDGDDNEFQLFTNWVAEPDATATLRVDLGQVQSIGAVRQLYRYAPTSTSVSVAETLAGSWALVLPETSLATPDSTSSFEAVSARYIDLTMKGTSVGLADLLELQVFPSSATEPAPRSGAHLDLTYLTGTSASINTNMGTNGGPRIHSVDGANGYYVKTAAQGATGDATLTLDLGQQYQISELALSWYANQTWPAGGKVDVDDGSGNWTTVFDSGHGTALGSTADGTQRISFATHPARFVRLTGYFDPGAAQGLLENIEVF